MDVTRNDYNRAIFYVQDGTTYIVQIYVGGALCSCAYFKELSRVDGRACCQHITAAIGKLGHKSFSDYIRG